MKISTQMNFLESFSRKRSSILLAFVCWGFPAHGAINLDKLNACDDIAGVFAGLRIDAGIRTAGCRAPASALEKALSSRTRLSDSQLCWQSDTPSRSLAGFSCARPEVPTGATLICFREAAAHDIRIYKQQYGEIFASPVAKYLSSSGKCATSNGDASSAVSTLFPTILGFISRFEFGFVTLLGKAKLTDSSAIHGYALVDPSISNAPNAIEFFSIFTGAKPYVRPGEKVSVSGWTVFVDDSHETNEAANAEFRNKSIPLNVRMTSYSMERRPAVADSQSKKLRLLSAMQSALAEAMQDEGFTEFSDSDLQEKTGRTGSQIVSEITRSMGFGAKDIPVKLSSRIHVLMNEKRPRCAENGEGAMAVYVFATEPIPGVRSDYGGIGFIVAGIGRCGRSNASAKTYMDGLKSEAQSRLLETLERQR